MKHLLTALLIAICALGQSQTTADADINGDGAVTVADVLFVLGNFGAIVPPQYCDAPCVDCFFDDFPVLASSMGSDCTAELFDDGPLYVDDECHTNYQVSWYLGYESELNSCEPLVVLFQEGQFEGQRVNFNFDPAPPGCIAGVQFKTTSGQVIGIPVYEIFGCFQGDQTVEFRFCDNEWHYVE